MRLGNGVETSISNTVGRAADNLADGALPSKARIGTIVSGAVSGGMQLYKEYQQNAIESD